MQERNKILVRNRRARRDYFVLERLEVGIALQGSEVKSLRAGKGNLQESYASIEADGVWLHNFHISPYQAGGSYIPPAVRKRRLLLHHREIKKLIGRTALKGNTLVPLSVYLRGAHVKVELGLVQGKKSYDRRETIKKREAGREMAQALKYRGR